MPYPSWNEKFNYTEQLDYDVNILSQNIKSSGFLQTIKNNLPPVFTRQTASKVIGGLMSAKTFSNLDAKGEGPQVKVKIGSKVGYERESFVRWLGERLSTW